MAATGFLKQLGVHGLTACFAFLLGFVTQFAPAASATMPALAALLGAFLLVTATTSWWLHTKGRSVGAVEPAPQPGPEPIAEPEALSLQLARHDALTGLPNRDVLMERLDKLLAAARHSDRETAVLAIDLVDFKAINATLGFAAGDLLLRHVAARLLTALRETDGLARVGADRFLVVQADVTSSGAAADLGERLLAALAEPFDLCGQLQTATARIGIAVSTADQRAAETLIEQAGLALASATTEHGPYRFFDDAVDGTVRARKALEQDLGQALANDQLDIHYQPQFDLGSRRMVGVEALLRWQHPVHGRIEPDQFIPLAEATDLIRPIGAWVLEQACAQTVRWQQAGATDLRIAVNLSLVQLEDPDFPAVVSAILARARLPAATLKLEITERALMIGGHAALERLARLKDLGIRISIDDLGSGHSTFACLHQFPFDEIKVDQALVGAVADDRHAQAIVATMLGLGQGLDLDVVAEGVECADQLRRLGEQGCPVAQGFYFSRAVHPAEIDVMVEALTNATIAENASEDHISSAS